MDLCGYLLSLTYQQYCPYAPPALPHQASSAKQISSLQRRRSARLLGECAVSRSLLAVRYYPNNDAVYFVPFRPRVPFSLHLAMAEAAPSVPTGQPGLGVSEVWPLNGTLPRGQQEGLCYTDSPRCLGL